MAINHWKIGGEPTSYNPLPTGTGNNILLELKEYVMIFKAKSESNASLNLFFNAEGRVEGARSVIKTLTNSFTLYEFKIIGNSDKLYVYDHNSIGDIIIEDIELVEKPLGISTINGIDGFLSGKWSLHANATVIDDETLELNATAGFQESSLIFDVLPNANYTFNGYREGRFILSELDNSNSVIAAPYSDSSNTTGELVKTFKTTSTTKKIKVALTCSSAGTFTFKRPQLVLGSQSVPYEKKRGDRMVEPVPRKNLFSTQKLSEFDMKNSVTVNDSTNEVSITATSHAFAKKFEGVEQDKTYIFSWLAKKGTSTKMSYSVYDGTNNVNIFSPTSYEGKVGADWTFVSISFVIPKGCRTIWVYPLRDSGSTGTVYLKDFQLEQGTLATAYEPYAVQVNPHAKGLVPKKNLIPSFRDSRWSKHANLTVNGDYDATLNATADNQFSEFWFSANPNIPYTISASEISSGASIQYYEFDGNNSAITGSSIGSTKLSATFTTNANTKKIRIRVQNNNTVTGLLNFKEPMLTEGSQQHAFEPLTLVNPRSPKGLVLDGKTGYVEVADSPDMRMGTSDFEIEVSFTKEIPSSSAQFLIAKDGGGTAGSLEIYISSGTLYSRINGVQLNSISGLDDGIRHDVRLSVKSGIAKFIVDGVDGTTFNVSYDLNHSSNLFLGKRSIGNFFEGILHKVKITKGSNVVAHYDFTEPTGTAVYNGGEPPNLLPYFDSGEWSLHANADVYGKDVLVLDATANYQYSHIYIPVENGKTYKIKTTGLYEFYKGKNLSGSYLIARVSDSTSRTFTVDETYEGFITFVLSNVANGAGKFTFQAPRLIKIPSNQATINGHAQPQTKRAKRQLYALR